MLTLGWTDVYSFVPVGFNMLSPANKSNLKIGIEFQCRNYGGMVCHISIMFICHILLERIRRNKNDERSYGELFYIFCDEIRDMDLTNALQSLMALFVNLATTLFAQITEMLKTQVCNWMVSQTKFIQSIFSDLCWKS